MLGLTLWRDLDGQAPTARTHPLDTVWVQRSTDFVYWTWDVPYRTWGGLLGANLDELPPPTAKEEVDGFELNVVGFTGGTYRGRSYHPLSYWLTRELARVRRTHRLPPTGRLYRYLRLSDKDIGYYWLAPAYRPLLAQLLCAYQACPLPAATARRLAQARQALAAPSPPAAGPGKK